MSYATVQDVQARMTRTLSEAEEAQCAVLLEDAAVMIDTVAPDASPDAAKIVSCRMVIRVLDSGMEMGVPVGATQGSQAALGYSQSWTFNSGANGELYLAKAEKRLLGLGDKIGAGNPLERGWPYAEGQNCNTL